MSEGEIERLTRMLEEMDFELAILRRAFEDYNEREKQLRHCLKWFVSRDYYDRNISFEEAIQRSRRVLGEKE
jgi:hypothetical protein